MNIREYEDSLLRVITDVVEGVVERLASLPISSTARSGAEISEYLAAEFVAATRDHEALKRSEAAPPGATKHPWDARTFFEANGSEEEVWIDFKALKVSATDSNPDVGTPEKIITFIEAGGFYLAFVFVFYEEAAPGIRFVKRDGRYTKSYWVKDISSTVRCNPKNQLQVNASAKPEYRSREEFIALLFKKLGESYDRQIKKAKKRLDGLDDRKTSVLLANERSSRIAGVRAGSGAGEQAEPGVGADSR